MEDSRQHRSSARRHAWRLAAAWWAVTSIAAGTTALAQAPEQQPATRPAASGAGAPVSPETATLPPIIVTAQKQEQSLQDVPQSVTALSGEAIRDADVRNIRDASLRAPNVLLQQFTVPRLSFPFVRGIGSGRNSPAVTTYIDDVPQLSFATSNIEFLDLDRIEFLRGSQGTLYGRNALGGVVNLYSRQPTNAWEVDSSNEFGNYALQDYRLSLKGPLVADQVYVGVAGGYLSRNGYSQNDVTGEKVDDRDHLFGRAELRFTPGDRWDVRVTVNGERDRDGDYALFDLASVIARPRHFAHDFTGFSDRDVSQVALTAHYAGERADFVSISALQHWRSQDVTDLDETALDLIRRNNRESQQNFIQEFRLTNPQNKPVVLSNDLKARWIVGTFFFASDENQFAFNDYRPGAVGIIPGIPGPFQQYETQDVGTYGVSIYGQGTLLLRDRLEFTAGLRYDYEHAQSDLGSSPFTPVASVSAADDFSQVSPRFEVGYHWTPDVFTYGSATRGFKAGGFSLRTDPLTPTAPGTDVPFGQETSWTYEAGVKSTWLGGRLRANAAYYYTQWENLQLDTPTGAPGVFYIANAGDATSHGVEVEASASLVSDPRGVGTVDVFGGGGVVNTNFGAGAANQGADVGGHGLPFAPDFTFNVGVQYSRDLTSNTRAYVRAEVFGVGRYFYDASNAAAQDAYALANFRVGIGGDSGRVGWRVEGFINNAFNATYVPLAFPFALARSGYVGESGAPQTVGLTLNLTY